MTHIDIVAAVRSEAETLPEFVRQLRTLELPPDIELGAIFIEDSSDDDTVGALRRFARGDPGLRYFALERGYGQGPAIAFGLQQSRADAIIMMDVDGSHPLAAVPEMIRRYLAGARVVQCRRRSIEGRAAYRDVGTTAFHLTARLVSGVDLSQQNVYFRLVRADVAAEILARPELWPWLRFELPSEDSGELAFVDVDARERRTGESKYAFGRLLRIGIDGMLAVTSLLRLIGLAIFAFGSALFLSRAGHDLLAALVALPALAGVWHYFALRRADPLARMRVVQTSVVTNSTADPSGSETG
ncbi:MAG: glycosyltransferase [Deltaproteobacteria bacterium]|nr:glycosyltransferase [Deltaproteobacteria bacterium]MBW2361510.1 glycosyltransferase [Deltaproteobacteria bacterium]